MGRHDTVTTYGMAGCYGSVFLWWTKHISWFDGDDRERTGRCFGVYVKNRWSTALYVELGSSKDLRTSTTPSRYDNNP
jgi:hypothetical protein